MLFSQSYPFFALLEPQRKYTMFDYLCCLVIIQLDNWQITMQSERLPYHMSYPLLNSHLARLSPHQIHYSSSFSSSTIMPSLNLVFSHVNTIITLQGPQSKTKKNMAFISAVKNNIYNLMRIKGDNVIKCQKSKYKKSRFSCHSNILRVRFWSDKLIYSGKTLNFRKMEKMYKLRRGVMRLINAILRYKRRNS